MSINKTSGLIGRSLIKNHTVSKMKAKRKSIANVFLFNPVDKVNSKMKSSTKK